MEIRRFEPVELFSQIVVHGDTAYLSGVVADGRSVTEQTASVLAEIDKRLAQVGSDRSKLLSATIWLADIKTWSEMNDVWRGWIDPDAKPARATVEARLADPRYLVEMMVVAAI